MLFKLYKKQGHLSTSIKKRKNDNVNSLQKKIEGNRSSIKKYETVISI